MNMRVPFSPPDITEEEIQAVCEVLRSGWITTGPKTKAFEEKLEEFCGAHRIVCLSSATSALELNLRMLGVGKGDEIIVPAYTYTASVSPAVHLGATIKFIDCMKDTFEMDYDKMEEAINENTKAVIAVDLGGIVCNYERIYRAVERKKHLFKPASDIQCALGRVAVIADSAHALGAERYGKKTGNIADFSSYSFHAVKNLTTAEGGAITWTSLKGIDDDDIYKKYQMFSLHGQSRDAFEKNTNAGSWEYDVVGAWYKCNMTDVAAALGLKQLERYPSILERRRKIIEKYDETCDSLGVFHLKHYTDEYKSSGHLYITRIPGITGEQRNEIILEMGKLGVSCNVHYKPLPMMTAYREMGFDIADFPNAYDFFINEITLPLHTKLTDEDVEHVCKCFKEVVAKYI